MSSGNWSTNFQALKMRVILAILIIHVVGVAGAQTDAERAVLDLSSRKFDWLIARQVDSLEKVLDEKVQYIHSNGWVQTKREVIDDMRSGKLVYRKVTIKEALVRLYSETAILTGLSTFEGINGGTAFLLDLRYTEVYVRATNHWVLVSRHSNRMP